MPLNASRKLDFLVVGSTPMATMLAFYLRRSHRCEVGVLADPPHPLRVSRGFDISVSALTRPESWQVLKACTKEVERTIGGFDRKMLETTDVAMTGHGERAGAALGHIRHMSSAFGVLSEPLTRDMTVRYGGGFVVRGATRLKRRKFNESVRAIIEGIGATWLTFADCQMEWGSGPIRLETGEMAFVADTAIVCDAGLAAQISPALAWPSELETIEHCGLMTEPGAQASWPCLMDVGNEGLACSHPDGRLEAWVAGNSHRAEKWLAGMLAHGSQTRLSGRVLERSITSKDRGPVVAQLARSHVHVALGFGASEVFFTPALARHFAQKAQDHERTFFEARGIGARRGPASEYRAVGEEA